MGAPLTARFAMTQDFQALRSGSGMAICPLSVVFRDLNRRALVIDESIFGGRLAADRSRLLTQCLELRAGFPGGPLAGVGEFHNELME